MTSEIKTIIDAFRGDTKAVVTINNGVLTVTADVVVRTEMWANDFGDVVEIQPEKIDHVTLLVYRIESGYEIYGRLRSVGLGFADMLLYKAGLPMRTNSPSKRKPVIAAVIKASMPFEPESEYW